MACAMRQPRMACAPIVKLRGKQRLDPLTAKMRAASIGPNRSAAGTCAARSAYINTAASIISDDHWAAERKWRPTTCHFVASATPSPANGIEPVNRAARVTIKLVSTAHFNENRCASATSTRSNPHTR